MAETVRDLKLDDSGDLHLDGADLALVAGGAAIAQAVKVRLSFFAAEWFLDESVGLPFFESILVKSPNFILVQDLIRTEIENTPGVAAIEELDFRFDAALRKLSVRFRVSTDQSELVATVLEVEI